MNFSRPLFFSLATALALTACGSPSDSNPEGALKRTLPPVLEDDLPLEPLLQAIEDQIEHLENRPRHPDLKLGDRVYSQAEYLAGLRLFVSISMAARHDRESLQGAIEERFDFFEVLDPESKPGVFMTSYFEPWIDGSRTPTERFSQALYRRPDDLLILDLKKFDPKYKDDRILRGRVDGRNILPYYSREEIDARLALHGRGLEIAWADPLDVFFLQVQGSGVIHFTDREAMRLNFADKNGHRYEAIGKFLKDRIPPEKLNLLGIEQLLRSLPEEEQQAVLYKNPSYVFFVESSQSAVTSIGLPAVDGRTIASDSHLYPKGALGFLSFPRPKLGYDGFPIAGAEEPTSRWVLDQDTGGAIKGPGRIDLFWGRGPLAKLYAGAMKARGKLYYLGPKKDKRR